jgi:hypothetical protein
MNRRPVVCPNCELIPPPGRPTAWLPTGRTCSRTLTQLLRPAARAITSRARPRPQHRHQHPRRRVASPFSSSGAHRAVNGTAPRRAISAVRPVAADGGHIERFA